MTFEQWWRKNWGDEFGIPKSMAESGWNAAMGVKHRKISELIRSYTDKPGYELILEDLQKLLD